MTVASPSTLQLVGEGGHTAEFQINPGSEYFRMTVGKEVRMFKVVDLWAITYAIVGPEYQDKMTPVRQSEVVTYKRVHNVMLKKDMKKVEKVRVHCEINVEKTVVESLKGLLPDKKQISMGGVPIIGK